MWSAYVDQNPSWSWGHNGRSPEAIAAPIIDAKTDHFLNVNPALG